MKNPLDYSPLLKNSNNQAHSPFQIPSCSLSQVKKVGSTPKRPWKCLSRSSVPWPLFPFLLSAPLHFPYPLLIHAPHGIIPLSVFTLFSTPSFADKEKELFQIPLLLIHYPMLMVFKTVCCRLLESLYFIQGSTPLIPHPPRLGSFSAREFSWLFPHPGQHSQMQPL